MNLSLFFLTLALAIIAVANVTSAESPTDIEDSDEPEFAAKNPGEDNDIAITIMATTVSPFFGKGKSEISFHRESATIESKHFREDKEYTSNIYNQLFDAVDVASFCSYVERQEEDGESCGAGLLLKESDIFIRSFFIPGALIICDTYAQSYHMAPFSDDGNFWPHESRHLFARV